MSTSYIIAIVVFMYIIGFVRHCLLIFNYFYVCTMFWCDGMGLNFSSTGSIAPVLP